MQHSSHLLYPESCEFCFALSSQDTKPPLGSFFLLPFPGSYSMLGPIQDGWVALLVYISLLYYFLSFGSTSLRAFTEDKTIIKSTLAAFISDHLFLGCIFSSFCSPQVKQLFSFIIPVTRLSFFPADCSHMLPSLQTCHSLNYFPGHPKA